MQVHQSTFGLFMLALATVGCEQPDVSTSAPNGSNLGQSVQSTLQSTSSGYDHSTSVTKLADGIYYAVIDPGQNHLAIVDGMWRVVFEHVYEWAECDVSPLPNGGFQVSVHDFKGDDGESLYVVEFFPTSEKENFSVMVDGKPFQGFEEGFFREIDIEMLTTYLNEVYED